MSLKRRNQNIVSVLRRTSRRLWLVLLGISIILGVSIYKFAELKYRDSLQLAQKIFVDSIRYDLLTGADVEVLKKCRKYLESEIVEYVRVDAKDSRNICDLSKTGQVHGLVIASKTYFDADNTEEAAVVEVSYSQAFRYVAIRIGIIAFGIVFFLPLVVMQFFLNILRNKFVVPVESLANLVTKNDIKLLFELAPQGISSANAVSEIHALEKGISGLAQAIHESEKKLIAETKREAFVHFAEQTIHDVRSPIAALKVAASSLRNLPEEERILIRSAMNRIDDIIHGLRVQAKKIKFGLVISGTGDNNEEISDRIQAHLLSGVVENALAEKRLQYRAMVDVEICSEFDSNSYGIFVNVDGIELERLLSNLINNSVESFSDGIGRVKVTLGRKKGDGNGWAVLKVVDNGSGIRREIISRLGERGNTYGKDGGSGLGLYHAKSAVESWGGSLSIISNEGNGTEIAIELPIGESPNWFVSSLELGKNDKFVVIDDDMSIHNVWQSRVAAYDYRIINFTFPKMFCEWMESESRDTIKSAMYLFDHEFIGATDSGLDLIERYNLQQLSILVTSKYEDQRVRRRCEDQNIRMMPKNLIGLVPINIKENVGV